MSSSSCCAVNASMRFPSKPQDASPHAVPTLGNEPPLYRTKRRQPLHHDICTNVLKATTTVKVLSRPSQDMELPTMGVFCHESWNTAAAAGMSNAPALPAMMASDMGSTYSGVSCKCVFHHCGKDPRMHLHQCGHCGQHIVHPHGNCTGPRILLITTAKPP